MYGQLKFPILSNQNHGVIVSGEIHITDHETITHTIEGVESIVIDENTGEGKIVLKGGFKSLKAAIIGVKESNTIVGVDVTDSDGKTGEIEFETFTIASNLETGVITKTGDTAACKLSFIAVVTTA